jgi:hypothetical protein
MQTVKINIRNERSRYIALMDALMTGKKVEGGYVMQYSIYREQGERIGTFLLRSPEPAYERSMD